MVGILIPRAFMSRLDLCLRTCRSRSKVCQKAAVTCVSNLELFSHEKATHLNPPAGRPWSGGRASVPLSANLLRQHLLVLEHDWDYPLVPSHSDGIDGSSAAVADGTAVPDAACAGALPLCTRSPGGCGWLHALHLRLLHVRVDLLCHACCPCRADSLGRVHSRRPSGGGASRFAVPVPLGLRP